jgi:hypothetical protein
MRKLKMLAVLAIAFASCTTNTNQSEQQTPTLDATTRNTILTELEAKLTEEKGIPIKYESSEVIQIDNNYYLRSRSDEYVTTTLLRVNEVGALVGLGVSCTSTSCAQSTTGCVPKWVGDIPTCTKCTEGTKDCSRTFTSGTAVLQE